VVILGYEGFRIFRHPIATLSRLVQLVLVMRRFRPDVVHAHLFWSYVLGPFAARVARVPHVVASRRSLGIFRQSMPRHWLALERSAAAMTDLFIANSHAVRADVLGAERLPPAKVVVVHNGLDLSRFSWSSGRQVRCALGISSDALVALTVANLIAYKGHQHLFRAWAKVQTRYPGSILLLAGDGPMRAALEAQSRDLGLATSIRFLGSREDVASLLYCADVLVHPSLEEGFSNAILEAMAARKPVIATAVGGNSEAVVDGLTGLLVPAGKSEELAEAIVKLFESEEMRNALGVAGRHRVEQHFSEEQMLEGHASLYRGLIDGRLGRSRRVVR
jgi:glycosyltransferase involved in cell wall biosynthesis